MPDALPVPRDQRLLDAINWLMGCGGDFENPDDRYGNYWWRSVFQEKAGLCLTYDPDAGRYRWSPPVAPASPMPELECPWVLLSPDGQTDGAMYCTAQDAKEFKLPEERLARLAVVEVVDEPEAAPSGWRYLTTDDPQIVLAINTDGGIVGRLKQGEEPPIDREYVAALLREATDAR